MPPRQCGALTPVERPCSDKERQQWHRRQAHVSNDGRWRRASRTASATTGRGGELPAQCRRWPAERWRCGIESVPLAPAERPRGTVAPARDVAVPRGGYAQPARSLCLHACTAFADACVRLRGRVPRACMHRFRVPVLRERSVPLFCATVGSVERCYGIETVPLTYCGRATLLATSHSDLSAQALWYRSYPLFLAFSAIPRFLAPLLTSAELISLPSSPIALATPSLPTSPPWPRSRSRSRSPGEPPRRGGMRSSRRLHRTRSPRCLSPPHRQPCR
uniref:Uncharacterized protein n=1 Tax=Oryza meridionalis TaxID=40149 RepID=A0A0E0EK39_9ORYZ